MSRQEQVIWAAGFFDGEGCISVSQSKKGKPVVYYSLIITAGQNCRAPLDILVALFGGSVRRRPKEFWIWQLSGVRTVHALAEMLPFLIVKREQACLAVVFQNRKVQRGGKYNDHGEARGLDHQDYVQMRELKLIRKAG